MRKTKFSLLLTSASAICASLLSFQTAHAATAEAAPNASATDNEVETIIVSGQQRLSRDPQVAKKSAIAVVDSVGALEIQQLTDTTVADALTRIPGVALQRGYQTQKSWYVDIRGLGGNYNSVDLDGGMFIDSTRNDRANYLDTVPASAINELVVTKTITPDMDPNSIGGHISINTLRAFDLGGAPVLKGDISFNSYSQNGAQKSHDPGVAGNIVLKHTFGPEGNFGVVLAASAHDDRTSERYNNTATFTPTNGVDIPSGSMQRGNFDSHDYGYSFLGKLEMRSGDKFYGFATVDIFKEFIDQNNYRGGIALTASLISNATEGSGQFTGGTAQAYSRTYDIHREVQTFTTGFDYKVGDKSKLSVVASMGASEHVETLQSGATFNYTGLSGSYAFTPDAVNFNLTANSGLASPANWAVNPKTAAGVTHLPMQDNVYTLRADYNYNNFSFSRGLGFGAGLNARRLRRNFNQSADNYTLPTGTVYTLDQALATGGAASTFDGTGIVYVDAGKYWNYMRTNGIDTKTTTPTSSFYLIEDVYAGYASANYTTDKARILIGARYEYTNEDDLTAQLQGTTPVPYHFTRDYAYLLPNVQATYDLTPVWRVRAAFTETIARPTFTTFAQGLTINNFSSLTPFIRGSNSQLKARLSNNYDLALETYRPDGFASIALFRKDISHEVYYLTTTTFNATTGVTSQINTPYNAGTSTLTGIEIGGEWHNFTALSPLLKGFGLRANYTLMTGELGVIDSTGVSRKIKGLDQQPTYEANLIATYENGPFSGSLASASRGRAFNGGVGAVPRLDTWIAPTDTLNVRAAYRPVKAIELFVEGKNLTDSTWREQTGVDRRQLAASIKDGTTFVAGATFKY